MTKIKIYNIEGKEMEDMTLSDSIFAMPANKELIHQVAMAISGNRRQILAHTKTRGERAGSGIKPWKQKGTGRARVGSVRTPVWRKGGVAFGPRSNRNFTKKVNKKVRAKAMTMVLSGKIKDKELIAIDKLEFPEKKTKKIAEMLKNLNIKGKILMAFSDKEKNLRIISRNLNRVENILTSQLNVLDMLNSKYLLMSKESVEYLEKKYKKSK